MDADIFDTYDPYNPSALFDLTSRLQIVASNIEAALRTTVLEGTPEKPCSAESLRDSLWLYERTTDLPAKRELISQLYVTAQLCEDTAFRLLYDDEACPYVDAAVREVIHHAAHAIEPKTA